MNGIVPSREEVSVGKRDGGRTCRKVVVLDTRETLGFLRSNKCFVRILPNFISKRILDIQLNRIL